MTDPETEWLRNDHRIQLAAAIAAFFKIDPILVMECDYRTWKIRAAAYYVAVEQREKAYKEAQSR